jgi:hypothetical protein
MGLHTINHSPFAGRYSAAVFFKVVGAGTLKFCSLGGQLLLYSFSDIRLRYHWASR